MSQRKSDPSSSRDLAPLQYDSTRMVKAEPVYGDYYYGFAQSKSAQARSYFQLFSRQRWIILWVFLGVMVVGLLWLATRPKLYLSEAEILVTPMDRGGSSNNDPALEINVLTRVRSVATQVKLMRSPDVLNAAFKTLSPKTRLRGFGTTEEKLGNYPVDITNPKDTEIVGIDVVARDPMAASDFANAIMSMSVNQRSDNVKAMAEMATNQVAGELDKTDKELKAARADLAEYKQRYGINDLQTETATKASSLASMEASITQADADLVSAQQRRDTLSRELHNTSQNVISAQVISQNPIVGSIDDQIEKLEQERASLLLEYQPSAQEVKDKEQEITEAKRRKAETIKTITSSQTKSISPVYQAMQQEYINALVAIHEAQSRTSIMRSHAAMLRSQISMLPQFEERLAIMLSKIGELESTHSYLSSQLQSLKMSMHGGLPNVIPITHARPNRFPYSPNIPSSVLFMLVFAALASLGAAVLRDMLDDRIHTSDRLESAAGYRVLASIPTVRNGFRGLVTDDSSPVSLLENFRILRNNIFLTAQEPQARIIVVTSPGPSEGKSTTIANLAITTAISHKRVLLIDADLRHPSIHLTFGLSNEVGLSTVLEDEADLQSCIQQTAYSTLHVLPAGPTPAFPPELLASPAMNDLLAMVREQYDTVLLDSTPLVNLSDGAQIASMADGAIMVISAAKTEQGKLLEALRILEGVGVPVLGVVYNRSTDTPPLEWGETLHKALEYHEDERKRAA